MESEAFQKGWDDYYDGVPEEGNPYLAGSDKELDWNDGWNTAFNDAEGVDMRDFYE
jgi:hypothetical protein